MDENVTITIRRSTYETLIRELTTADRLLEHEVPKADPITRDYLRRRSERIRAAMADLGRVAAV